MPLRSFRTILGSLVLVACATTSLPAPCGDSPPVVRTDAGRVSGIHDARQGLDEFKGIPYAAPPIAGLRWKPPQPVKPWKGVHRADHFGPRCMQLPVFGDMVFRSDGMSEDCLYLNVWTPAGNRGRKLPVLVYFYGGGYIAGDGSEYRYDGASLARRGIVTVTVNYRLGVFGFLALPALAAESPHHATGNYGLLDQVAALEWVHRNIAAFGGNPGEVTVGGESAGSISVSALMASPLSRDLFQRAIGESGAMLGNLKPHPLAQAERQGEKFQMRVGAHSLRELRAMAASKLLGASGGKDAVHVSPDIDGWFLPRSTAAIYEAGRQAHIPLLVGSNSQEGYWKSVLGTLAPTPANYRARVKKLFGQDVSRVLKLYPGHSEAQMKASGTALAGDQFIAFSTWRWMHLQRTTGHAPVYYYYFTKGRPAKRDGSAGPDPGAVHSGEIEYALGNLASNHVYAWTRADRTVSSTMEAYFANFIKTGQPNGPGLPHWPAAAPMHGGLLRQEIGVHTHTFIDRRTPRYQFLERYDSNADDL